MRALAPRGKAPALPGRGERVRRFEHQTARQMFEPMSPTLDERISSTWSALVAEGSAECPVCAGQIRAAQTCERCGSELS